MPEIHINFEKLTSLSKSFPAIEPRRGFPFWYNESGTLSTFLNVCPLGKQKDVWFQANLVRELLEGLHFERRIVTPNYCSGHDRLNESGSQHFYLWNAIKPTPRERSIDPTDASDLLYFDVFPTPPNIKAIRDNASNFLNWGLQGNPSLPCPDTGAVPMWRIKAVESSSTGAEERLGRRRKYLNIVEIQALPNLKLESDSRQEPSTCIIS